MNKKILSLLLLITPIFTFAQEKGLDQQIDEVFGKATGWFVNIIFYQIPFSDDIKVFWVLFPLIIGATYFTIFKNYLYGIIIFIVCQIYNFIRMYKIFNLFFNDWIFI